MDPEKLAEIAAANAEEVERAKAAARPTESGWSDTIIGLDNASQVAELAARAGGALWDGVCAVGSGIGAVCEAVDSVIPRID
ncbi:hypothetical protein [Roseomonas indoligenes]|uniref:Uncharacterized protein n=1 Tax=Roseomonas indoligenes TaxID=2820811 RepID=A0A940MSN6_9PROT|nr:hypothetical protein [Pararoseomonas indoligenes]MBP0493368.1 hypothetical protein [Pararoseomonas indoligenes]